MKLLDMDNKAHLVVKKGPIDQAMINDSFIFMQYAF